MDKHGNINAAEGCDRCVCGCKYWENDKCIDCGRMVEVAKNEIRARDELEMGLRALSWQVDIDGTYVGMTEVIDWPDGDIPEGARVVHAKNGFAYLITDCA